MARWHRSLLATLSLAWLVACGGGGGGSPPEAPPAVAEIVGPGRLVRSTLLNRIEAAEIARALQTTDERIPAVQPVYAVSNHRLSYLTIDGQGREIQASGLLSVPHKPAGARSPLIGYQHGTIFSDAEAPSQHAQGDEAAVVIASLGYIVVAADYVGFGDSKGAEHPYLLARPSAAAVLDLLTAARRWLQQNQVVDNGQLYLVGYSEGGYVTMAAHRALQDAASAELPRLVMSIAGGGPYNVQRTLDELLRRVRGDYPLLGALISPGLLKNLGSTLRDAVRKALLRQLIPADADVSYQTDVIDNYLADDSAAIERDSNVHDWRPAAPLAIFHGRDDQTVPYASATSTLQAMLARSAPQVSLSDCGAVPAGHRECVVPYWTFMLNQLATTARDR